MSFAPVRAELSALPLAALTAAAIDTETTGLAVTRDRVIEIAGVRVRAGALDEADRLAMLVNPGVPIPAMSTAVHRLSDPDVADAPGFPDAMAALARWAGSDVVLGYSIGYDLAILQAEHDRHDLAWRAPRGLDVRHLVQLVAPASTPPSLEAAASWLGIGVAERHRALPDAVLAARVFLALLPKLRDRGIVTLAQAERASRSLAARTEREAIAGWPTGGLDDAAPYARVDSFPYRHRVADVMHAPPLVVAPDASLREALAVLMREGTSSVFVASGDPDGVEGILTERDVLRAIDADPAGGLAAPVARYASRPLATVRADEMLYRALVGMAAKGFRHLGVRDADGRLIGALSARDLLRQRADDAVSLGDSIDQADSAAALGQVWAALTVVARGLVAEQVDARDIAAIVSRELRALTHRACVLAERDMAAASLGPPPVSYAMLVLGSGGRGESLLAMDQDNAIVFSAGTPGGAEDRWLRQLGQRVADSLNQAGVAYCKGGIMAARDAWRRDEAGWRAEIAAWVAKSRPEDVLNSDIFFDAVPVHGDAAMAERLHAEALRQAAASRLFLQAMAINAADVSPPIGWFGRFRLEQGRVDLKNGGIMPIFAAARVLALRHGLTERATPARLIGARDAGGAESGRVDDLIEAHRILLDAVLRQQLADIDAGIVLSNRVAVRELSAYRRQELRWALQHVAGVPDLLGVPDLVAR